MILNIDELKNACHNILAAIDSSNVSVLTETLELKTQDNFLFMNITNREYYVRVKIDLKETLNFHTTVEANKFLKLIDKTTTETVELVANNNYLYIRGNGEYRLPLIFEGDKLLELPEININNITSNFDMPSETLRSIKDFNSKEINKGAISRPVQKMYYIDNQGCITFTSGACVNSFTLPENVKFLLPERIVRLFGLFKDDQIKVCLGYDSLSEDIIQTKIRFESNDVIITSILSFDDEMLNMVPAKTIRGLAENNNIYNIVIDKSLLIEAINRLTIVGNSSKKVYASFNFNDECVKISDTNNNEEKIYYDNVINVDDTYEAILDLNDFKATLEGIFKGHVTIGFGNHKSMVIKNNTITNVIPECRLQ